jgi:sugar lactone lactonase YvrE
MQNHLIRRVDAKTKVISTVAGTGQPGFGGDGGPAVKAQFRQPHSIAFDPQGRLLVCDIGNHRVRRIDMKTGMIETYIGTGAREKTPDGAPVKGTPVNGPRALDLDPKGNLYLVLREGNMVFRIDPKTETMHHIAGTGEKGHTGDGADARQAKLNGPKGISWAPDNSVYIADTESHTIRRIDLKTGFISTEIGDGERGDGPEPVPAKCRTARPHGVFVDKKGVVYVGDSEAHRVRVLK